MNNHNYYFAGICRCLRTQRPRTRPRPVLGRPRPAQPRAALRVSLFVSSPARPARPVWSGSPVPARPVPKPDRAPQRPPTKQISRTGPHWATLGTARDPFDADKLAGAVGAKPGPWQCRAGVGRQPGPSPCGQLAGVAFHPAARGYLAPSACVSPSAWRCTALRCRRATARNWKKKGNQNPVLNFLKTDASQQLDFFKKIFLKLFYVFEGKKSE